MSYTLSEAAKAVGKSKTTIHRAIKSGKISASKLDSGAYDIDPSELHRVFQIGTVERTTRNDTKQHETAIGTADIRLEMLEKERERERQQLEETIADLREDRDKWRQQATALLEDKRPKRRWFWNK
jgi:excisionase family DNA binding protein